MITFLLTMLLVFVVFGFSKVFILLGEIRDELETQTEIMVMNRETTIFETAKAARRTV